MILYLHTSALVKPYAEEEGTETVERAVDEAEAVATSVVAYAEARAALARKLREDVFSPEKHREAVEALDEDWETLDKPEVSEDLVREAGDLAEEHALRGFDAIHLAPPYWYTTPTRGKVTRRPMKRCSSWASTPTWRRLQER